MGNRIYNILFHTHTVSGIVISVALYVIFLPVLFPFLGMKSPIGNAGIPLAKKMHCPVALTVTLAIFPKHITFTAVMWNYAIITTREAFPLA